MDYLKKGEEAKDYEVKKAKQERDNLVNHYEGIFKKKQQVHTTSQMAGCFTFCWLPVLFLQPLLI